MSPSEQARICNDPEALKQCTELRLTRRVHLAIRAFEGLSIDDRMTFAHWLLTPPESTTVGALDSFPRLNARVRRVVKTFARLLPPDRASFQHWLVSSQQHGALFGAIVASKQQETR